LLLLSEDGCCWYRDGSRLNHRTGLTAAAFESFHRVAKLPFTSESNTTLAFTVPELNGSDDEEDDDDSTLLFFSFGTFGKVSCSTER
jgi:hypothetical protein